MFKDLRKGWLANLNKGSKVGISHKGVVYGGVISLVTATGVMLVHCTGGLKFKIMPDGFSSTKDSEVVPYGEVEES